MPLPRFALVLALLWPCAAFAPARRPPPRGFRLRAGLDPPKDGAAAAEDEDEAVSDAFAALYRSQRAAAAPAAEPAADAAVETRARTAGAATAAAAPARGEADEPSGGAQEYKDKLRENPGTSGLWAATKTGPRQENPWPGHAGGRAAEQAVAGWMKDAAPAPTAPAAPDKTSTARAFDGGADTYWKSYPEQIKRRRAQKALRELDRGLAAADADARRAAGIGAPRSAEEEKAAAAARAARARKDAISARVARDLEFTAELDAADRAAAAEAEAAERADAIRAKIAKNLELAAELEARAAAEAAAEEASEDAASEPGAGLEPPRPPGGE